MNLAILFIYLSLFVLFSVIVKRLAVPFKHNEIVLLIEMIIIFLIGVALIKTSNYFINIQGKYLYLTLLFQDFSLLLLALIPLFRYAYQAYLIKSVRCLYPIILLLMLYSFAPLYLHLIPEKQRIVLDYYLVGWLFISS